MGPPASSFEIAPGVNLERDLLAKMSFRPEIAADLREMDPAIFSHAPISLAQRSPLTLQTRSEHRPEGDLVLLTLEGFGVDTIGEADPLDRAVSQRLRMIPCGRDVIVDCDGFELGLPAAPRFLQLLWEHEQLHSGSWAWYCTDPLLRRELRRAFLDAQRSTRSTRASDRPLTRWAARAPRRVHRAQIARALDAAAPGEPPRGSGALAQSISTALAARQGGVTAQPAGPRCSIFERTSAHHLEVASEVVRAEELLLDAALCRDPHLPAVLAVGQRQSAATAAPTCSRSRGSESNTPERVYRNSIVYAPAYCSRSSCHAAPTASRT